MGKEARATGAGGPYPSPITLGEKFSQPVRTLAPTCHRSARPR